MEWERCRAANLAGVESTDEGMALSEGAASAALAAYAYS
jgi:hypothetical protein